jgi:hypothetical protein
VGESSSNKHKGLQWAPIQLHTWPSDLTCYAHEARLVDHLTTDNTNAARTFAGTFRYTGDTLSADNPSFGRYVKLVGNNEACVRQVYPDYLSLNKTTDGPESVDYLGLCVPNTPRAFRTNVADNKQRLPVPKVNYPNLRGNLGLREAALPVSIFLNVPPVCTVYY